MARCMILVFVNHNHEVQLLMGNISYFPDASKKLDHSQDQLWFGSINTPVLVVLFQYYLLAITTIQFC